MQEDAWSQKAVNAWDNVLVLENLDDQTLTQHTCCWHQACTRPVCVHAHQGNDKVEGPEAQREAEGGPQPQ